MPPGALFGAILFVFIGLVFQAVHCGVFNNIYVVNQRALTTYILSQKAPRGAFSAMTSNIPAGREPPNKTAIPSGTISEAYPSTYVVIAFRCLPAAEQLPYPGKKFIPDFFNI